MATNTQNANSSNSSKASSTRRVEYATWKIPYSSTVSTSQLGVYSLFDLLYYESGNSIFPRQTKSGDSKGLRLEHDIICLDTSILNDSGGVDTTKSTFDGWASRGIDVLVADPDRRAPAVIKELPYTGSSIKTSTHKGLIQIKTYNKDNISMYTNLGKLMDNNIKYGGAGKTDVSNDHVTWEQEKYVPLSLYGEDDENLKLGTQDIILCDRDSSFETSMITAANKVYPYNSLLLNIQSSTVVSRVYYILLKNSNVQLDTLFDDNGSVSAEYGKEVGDYIKNDELNLKDPQQWDTATATKMKEILSHTFVYLRCSYFGDYVKYQDFNQDLNEDSDVVHKNIMVSSDGDFNRYDKYMSDSTKSSKTTRSYLPQTSPSEDLLSGVIAGNEGLSKYDEDNGATIAELRERKYKDSTLIGSFWTENINESDDELTHKDHLTPLQYYDIEAVKSDVEYNKENNNKPVLIPESGNIIADGRIFSPTIDEIWSYFKKLVSGRDADINLSTKGTTKTNGVSDEGAIVNSNVTAGDTRPSEGRQLMFGVNHNSKGDPISTKITTSGGIEKLNIDKWVNTPDSFRMVVYDYLVSVSDEVVRFSKKDWNNAQSEAKGSVLENNKDVPEIISHDIRTIAAESDSVYKDYGTDNGNTTSIVESKQTNVLENGEYGPRAQPYSLRELELLLKNCKYNINSLMHFLVKNFTVNNQLSYRSYEDDCNQTQSALYQFHRDYNSDISNPNTFFNKKGRNAVYRAKPYTENDEGGISAVFNDNDKDGAEGLVPHNQSKIYGKASTLPDNSDDYSSSDVYLAADGTWRYVFDHVRTPVLVVKY